MANGYGKYKIGKSKNVEQRKKTLQTANDSELVILYRREFDDCKRAEDTLHNIFSANRRRGEWFSLMLQEKVLLEKIFTLQGLTEHEKQSLQRMNLL